MLTVILSNSRLDTRQLECLGSLYPRLVTSRIRRRLQDCQPLPRQALDSSMSVLRPPGDKFSACVVPLLAGMSAGEEDTQVVYA